MTKSIIRDKVFKVTIHPVDNIKVFAPTERAA